ncbi:MAG: anti-sigma factor [Sphingomonas sp.]
MTDDEKFFAWLDGELAPAAAAEMEARVAADPDLARLAERHRALGAQLRGAFDPIAAAPVPEYLRTTVRPTADVVDFAAAKRARTMPGVPQWAAMAATLAVGVLVGTMVPQRSTAPVEADAGRLYAAASLNRALETELASAPAGDVRIGVTFRDRAGEICRSFAGNGSSGLACRNNGRWQVQGLFASPEGQASSYRMAAGMDPNLAALVDSSMAGEPFDADQEKAAKAKGWR